MAKERFDRSRAHVNIGTIGQVDHSIASRVRELIAISGADNGCTFVLDEQPAGLPPIVVVSDGMMAEYELIKQKKSELPRRRRDEIVREIESQNG